MSNPPETPTAPHPYIQTRSPHNVKLWIEEGKKGGRLKNCWHLGVDEVRVDETDRYFVPGCAHHSFESNFAHVSDDMQLQILQHSLGNNPVSCPKNCTFYDNRKWAWTKFTARQIFTGLYNTTRELLKGFASLSWQTPIGLIGFAVLVIAPKWVPLLISLAKAIGGKTP